MEDMVTMDTMVRGLLMLSHLLLLSLDMDMVMDMAMEMSAMAMVDMVVMVMDMDMDMAMDMVAMDTMDIMARGPLRPDMAMVDMDMVMVMVMDMDMDMVMDMDTMVKQEPKVVNIFWSSVQMKWVLMDLVN